MSAEPTPAAKAFDDQTIAVVLPVYNRAGVIEQALDCVRAQTLPPNRLIVVDDGSTDDTARRVELWLARHGAAVGGVMIRQANQGVAAARRMAIVHADHCGLLAFLDSDDLWPADYLSRMRQAMANHPGAVAAHCDLCCVNETDGSRQFVDLSMFAGNSTPLRFDLSWQYTRRNKVIAVISPPLPSCTVVRAWAYHGCGGYDASLRIRNDLDFHLRLSLLGPWAHVPGEPVVYRRRVELSHGGAEQLTRYIEHPRQNIVACQVLVRFLLEHGREARLPCLKIRRQMVRYLTQCASLSAEAGDSALAADFAKLALRVIPFYRLGARRKMKRLLSPGTEDPRTK